MFAYLRYFAAISFVLIVIAAYFAGRYFKDVAADDIKLIVERNNVSLAVGYVNSTWKPYREVVRSLEKQEQAKWLQNPDFVTFSRASFLYFEGLPVAKLNIYNAQMLRFLSDGNSEVIINEAGDGWFGLGGEKIDNKQVFEQARQGKVVSRIIEEGAFRAPNGTLKKGVLIQTLIPIIPDEYVDIVTNTNARKVDGVIEMFYDITPQWNQLGQFQVVSSAGIITIFLVLLGALFITAQRAEAIIARKHEENLELASAKARAEAESLEKSQFLANISHELRTPLNAIIGFSEIMVNETYGPVSVPQYQEYLRDIYNSGEHLLGLINDILDFSKAEAGKLELEFAEADVTKLMKSCIRLVMPRAEKAEVRLVENLPSEHIVMTTDSKRLKQVLLNLLSNAVKFTPAGGQVTLMASPMLIGNGLRIVVKDTGIGISQKDISKAMSAFGQIDSALSRKYEGTGLGLPLTRKLVELLGGTFMIQSEQGMGTTITIELPFAPVNKASAA